MERVSGRRRGRVLERISVYRSPIDNVIEHAGGKTGFIEVMKAAPAAKGEKQQKSLIRLTAFRRDDGRPPMYSYIDEEDEWLRQAR